MRTVFFLLTIVAALAQESASPEVKYRSAIIDGHLRTFPVIGESMIVEGDILMPIPATQDKQNSTRAARVTSYPQKFWPDGIVAYEIDPALADQSRVTDAIRHWNDKLGGVIRFVPRTSESNWIRFQSWERSYCYSYLGMVGAQLSAVGVGAQAVILGSECTAATVIHELGHVLGMHHEQSRIDRDRYIVIHPENFDLTFLDQLRGQAADQDLGPYDYGSILHYLPTFPSRSGGLIFDTRPAGIPTGVATGLSAADIDAARRLYGKPPTETTIDSNPPGLQVIVDGETYTTPRAFNWAPGTRHTLRAATQSTGNTRYEFVRWSDEGAPTHDITASPRTTVFIANFIPYFKITVQASPPEGGTVSLYPESPDGYYRNISLIQVAAAPSGGYDLAGWNEGPAPGALRQTGYVLAPFDFVATFSQAPLTTIDTDPQALQVTVDGKLTGSPVRFAWEPGSTHSVSATENVLYGATRYQFRGWTDGGPRERTVTAGSASSTLLARYQRQFQVIATAIPGGRVVLEPASADGYYDEGTTLTLRAIPDVGFRFSFWSSSGSIDSNPIRTIIVSEQFVATAAFIR